MTIQLVTLEMPDLKDFIETDKKGHFRQPFFKGTSVGINCIFDCLASGESIEEFLSAYPEVTKDQARAVLFFASELLMKGGSESLQSIINEDQVLEVSPEMLAELNRRSKDVKDGKFSTDKDVNREIDSWLNE